MSVYRVDPDKGREAVENFRNSLKERLQEMKSRFQSEAAEWRPAFGRDDDFYWRGSTEYDKQNDGITSVHERLDEVIDGFASAANEFFNSADEANIDAGDMIDDARRNSVLPDPSGDPGGGGRR
ncbi:hypothetical protein AB0L99_21605 [Streptomyces sp. NPDC051954]|uniref:hypothetical protein n=1 Tax=unclassified Streptomyces TaxID=2593676 RepID=UPI003413CC24